VTNSKSKKLNPFNRDFFILWQENAISKIGTYLFDIALILWLQEKANSAGFFAIILIASNIPEILLSPFGGTLADTFSRRKILIKSLASFSFIYHRFYSPIFFLHFQRIDAIFSQAIF